MSGHGYARVMCRVHHPLCVGRAAGLLGAKMNTVTVGTDPLSGTCWAFLFWFVFNTKSNQANLFPRHAAIMIHDIFGAGSYSGSRLCVLINFLDVIVKLDAYEEVSLESVKQFIQTKMNELEGKMMGVVQHAGDIVYCPAGLAGVGACRIGRDPQSSCDLIVTL